MCGALDDLIVEAREEPDPERRIALYRQIEEGFFGPEGEMPFIPLHRGHVDRGRALLARSRARGSLQRWQWYNWTIDWEAKQAARR